MDFLGVRGFRASGRYRQAHWQMAQGVRGVLSALGSGRTTALAPRMASLAQSLREMAQRGVGAERIIGLVREQLQWQMADDGAHARRVRTQLPALETVLQTVLVASAVGPNSELQVERTARREGPGQARAQEQLCISNGLRALVAELVRFGESCETVEVPHVLPKDFDRQALRELKWESLARWQAFDTRMKNQGIVRGSDAWETAQRLEFISIYGGYAGNLPGFYGLTPYIREQGFHKLEPQAQQELLELKAWYERDKRVDDQRSAVYQAQQQCQKDWIAQEETHQREADEAKRLAQATSERLAQQREGELVELARKQVDTERQDLARKMGDVEQKEVRAARLRAAIEHYIEQQKVQPLPSKVDKAGVFSRIGSIFGVGAVAPNKPAVMLPRNLFGQAGEALREDAKHSDFDAWLNEIQSAANVMIVYDRTGLGRLQIANATPQALGRLLKVVTEEHARWHALHARLASHGNPSMPEEHQLADMVEKLRTTHFAQHWEPRIVKANRLRQQLGELHDIFADMLKSALPAPIRSQLPLTREVERWGESTDTRALRLHVCAQIGRRPQTRHENVGIEAMSANEALNLCRQYLWPMQLDLARLSGVHVEPQEVERIRKTWAKFLPN
ncbi:hypothetical protein PIN31115_04536 [Pandoraea iniqua]|uniref:Uncharacterized protein n=2 Tax=Pandoraea iniqua TaxID=2508288 RepID=A0A5E4YJF7_9BURK|nr:hypothetical protein PIN31115_04536 [Pandoraea iniqua]